VTGFVFPAHNDPFRVQPKPALTIVEERVDGKGWTDGMFTLIHRSSRSVDPSPGFSSSFSATLPPLPSLLFRKGSNPNRHRALLRKSVGLRVG
jgi:hypothetical protein